MTPLKCPNPSCPFLFDPSQVPPGAVLACPHCGLRFTLAPNQQAPPVAPSTDLAFSSTSSPQARTTAKPKTREKTEVADEEDDDEEEDAPPKTISLKAIVLACVIVLILGGAGLFFVWNRVVERNKPKGGSNDVVAAELGLSFKKLEPSTGWERNDALRDEFSAKLFGYNRIDRPDGWFIADARKYEYAVRPTDLKERMNEQLTKNFSEIPPNLEGVPTTLLGLPATKYSFRGLHKESNTACSGEVTTLAMNTVGVWIYNYAGEQDFAGLEEAFQTARSSLRKIQKAGGDAAVRFEKPYRDKAGLFSVMDYEGLWAEKKDPKTQDDAAELWLRGTAKSLGRKDGPSTADLVVAVLEPSGDPKEQAEKHLLKQMNEGYKLENVTGDPTGDMPSSGELQLGTEVTRLKLRYPNADASANKLIAYSVVSSGGKTVVAYAYCTLKELEYWEQRMMQMVGSLKARK
jgi:hypothetical protein